MKVSFFGGAGMVTGANYLLETNGYKILIDCGLFQGARYCEELNFEKFPYDPKEIEAVFVTHAHIDHIGRLPKLLKEGFRGKIYSTQPTKDFAELLLIDSEHLLKEEAKELNKPPLYDLKDINNLMKVWEKRSYHEEIKINSSLSVEFFDAGHILGSSFVLVKAEGKKIVFSGDLGNEPSVLIKSKEPLPEIDYLVVESTYGDRLHENLEKGKEILEDLIEETVTRKGVLMIPAFALERTQNLLFELNELIENQKIPQVPVFVDSPLAINLTAIYKKYSQDPHYFSEEAIKELKKDDSLFDFPGLRMTLTKKHSLEIDQIPPPKVIIAGSGMSQGGRILRHESLYLPDPKNTILFIGYQAKGSLGRQILDGTKKVKIYGKEIPVNCQVMAISSYSAHADQAQLLNWIFPQRENLKKIFVVQGEEGSQVLAQKIKDELAIEAITPSLGDYFML